MVTSFNSYESRLLPLYFCLFMGVAILDAVSCKDVYSTSRGLEFELKFYLQAIDPNNLYLPQPQSWSLVEKDVKTRNFFTQKCSGMSEYLITVLLLIHGLLY